MADPVFVDDVTPLNAVNMNKLQTRDEKAVANGYPSLDATGKVPSAQLPPIPPPGTDLIYEGAWAAGTYQDGDVVVHGGVAYMCVGGPTVVAPDPAPWAAGTPPVLSTPWVPLWALGGSGASTVVPGTNLVAGENDLAWAGGSAIQVFHYVTAIAASAVRRYGAATMGAELTITATGAYPLTLRHNAASGTGAVFWMVDGRDRVLAPGESASFFYDANGSFWLEFGVLRTETYGTSLPGYPADGQEVTLVDSVTNPTYLWRLRYNAQSASGYKWEYVGGTPLLSGPQGDANAVVAASPTWTLLAGSPVASVPRDGIYLFEFGCDLQLTAGGTSTCFAALGRTLPSFAQVGTSIAVASSAQFTRAAGVMAQKITTGPSHGNWGIYLQAGPAAQWWAMNGWIKVIPVAIS